MTVPSELECPIAQDLLVPYVADEVRPETKAWLNAHLSRCESCRTALAALTDAAGAVAQAPAPPVPADPGRKLVGRVRLTVWIIIAAVVGMLALTGGSVYFGIQAITKLSGMDVEHPVPTADVSPAQVLAKLDVSDLGLKVDPAAKTASLVPTIAADAATLAFRNASGQPVYVEAIRQQTAADARRGFENFFNSFRSRTLSVQTILPSHAIAKFRSQGQYLYTWQADRWLFVISVADGITDPVPLRDNVRDHLFQAIREARP
jgi:predicted anti-sigma-YlaC factor YlaD